MRPGAERTPHSRLPLLYFSLAHLCLAAAFAALAVWPALAAGLGLARPPLVSAGAAALLAGVVVGSAGNLILFRRARAAAGAEAARGGPPVPAE